MDSFHWKLLFLFAAPAVLIWRKAFVVYLILVGALFALSWRWYLLPHHDGGGSTAMIEIGLILASCAALLGVGFRLTTRPIIAQAVPSLALRSKPLNAGWGYVLAAASGGLLGTFGWLLWSQLSYTSARWLPLTAGTTVIAVALYAALGRRRSPE